MIYKTYKNDIKIANIVLKDLQIFLKDFSIKADDDKLYPMSNKFWNKFLKDSEYENFKTISILDKYVPDYKFDFTNVKQGLYLLKFPDMYGMIISLSAKAKHNLETLLNLDIVYDSIIQIDPETFSFGFSVNKNDYKIVIDLYNERVDFYKIYICNEMLMSIENHLEKSLNTSPDDFNESIQIINYTINKSKESEFSFDESIMLNLDNDLLDTIYIDILKKLIKKGFFKHNKQCKKIINNILKTCLCVEYSVKDMRKELTEVIQYCNRDDMNAIIKYFAEIPIIEMI